MRALRLLSLGTALGALLLAFSPVGLAQDEKRPEGKGQFQGFGRGFGLLSPDAVDKLKLTAEQKEKYTKIEDEFKDKQKAAGEKMREAFQGKDREKIQEALQTLRSDGEKLRTDYLAKVEGILNAEQKKTFEDVKKEQPRGFGRPGAPGGGFGGARVGGQVLPPAAQESLKLSEEQKKKVESLQKELEDKILGVLTEEQKKQYEELKKGAAPRRPRNDL
jgi:Spy/CpxP family protein refolding chaperone